MRIACAGNNKELNQGHDKCPGQWAKVWPKGVASQSHTLIKRGDSKCISNYCCFYYKTSFHIVHVPCRLRPWHFSGDSFRFVSLAASACAKYFMGSSELNSRSGRSSGAMYLHQSLRGLGRTLFVYFLAALVEHDDDVRGAVWRN